MSGADRAGADDRRAHRAEIRKRRVHVGIRAANENRERARVRLLDGARGEGVDKPYVALPQFRREPPRRRPGRRNPCRSPACRDGGRRPSHPSLPEWRFRSAPARSRHSARRLRQRRVWCEPCCAARPHRPAERGDPDRHRSRAARAGVPPRRPSAAPSPRARRSRAASPCRQVRRGCDRLRVLRSRVRLLWCRTLPSPAGNEMAHHVTPPLPVSTPVLRSETRPLSSGARRQIATR